MKLFPNFFAWLVFLALPMPAQALESVTVMADHSLSLAMTKIAREYSRTSHAVVNTSFTPQAMQQAQITDGGSADILITPKAAWIADLRTQGLVDVYSQKTIARGRLALVGPADTVIAVNGTGRFPAVPLIQDMQAAGGEPAFLVGNPEWLMEGVYGKEALRNLNAADDLEPYTLYVKRLDQMFDMVTRQRAYGLFYYSSAIGRTDVKILDVLPDASHRPIEYYAVVIAGDNMDEARKFLDYLHSADARKALADSGFLAD